MAILNTIERVERDGADLVLHTVREPHLPRERYRVAGATVEPHVGDPLSFGCAGGVDDYGGVFGGGGVIGADGHEIPYRRIGAHALVQDWDYPWEVTANASWGGRMEVACYRTRDAADRSAARFPSGAVAARARYAHLQAA